jgi:cation transport regulator ChaC
VHSTKQRDSDERSDRKTDSRQKSTRVSIYGTASAQTNGLQKDLTICDAYVNTNSERFACSRPIPQRMSIRAEQCSPTGSATNYLETSTNKYRTFQQISTQKMGQIGETVMFSSD